MTISDDNKGTRDTVKTKKSNSKLPWWVEFFFVQLGLPENLLRKILKVKSNAKNHIKDNKKIYYTSIFLILGFLYINPIIKSAKHNDECVREIKQLLESGKLETKLNSASAYVNSVILCNGGN